jgi:PKD repeat protein
MKTIFTKSMQIAVASAILFISGFSVSAQIYEPEGLNLPGQWNNFVNPPAMGSVFGSSTQVSGGVSPISVGQARWQTTIHIDAANADTSAGTYSWLFTSGPTANAFANKWAGVNVVMNTIQDYQFNAGADNSITVVNGMHYTINWEDLGYQATRAIVMPTTSAPVSFNSVAFSPNTGITSADAVVVTAELSAVPSPEERFYMRYSIDNFATSAVLPMTVTLSAATATIPAQANGTDVEFYLFSSTILAPTADYDLISLNFINNGDEGNFVYSVGDPSISVNLGSDTVICINNFPLSLQVEDVYDSYLWSTGDQTSSILVDASGQYWVEVSLGSLVARDTIQVTGVAGGSISLGDDALICGSTPLVLSPGVSISPQGDSLTIIYDATQGQTGLVGATNVYMHSTYESIPFGGPITPWTGNWGVNDGIGQMTMTGNNVWSITINIYDYYGIDAGTPVNGLFMVFRNADGTAEGKDENGNDIFLDLSGMIPTSSFEGISSQLETSGYNGILWSNGATTPTISVTQAGTYSVTVFGVTGCNASDTIVVTSGSAPIVNLGPDEVLCNSQSTTLSAGAGFASYSWAHGPTTESVNVFFGGTYTVTVTNNQGCSATDAITITENVTPSAAFTWLESNGLMITFTPSAVSAGNSFAWDFDTNGSVDNTNAGVVNYTYPSTGQYEATLTVTNVCGTNTSSQNLALIGLGINTAADSKGLKLSPNPSSESITLSADGNIGNLQFYNSIGQMVKQINLSSEKQTSISVQDLNKGVYFIKQVGISNSKVIRFVKN